MAAKGTTRANFVQERPLEYLEELAKVEIREVRRELSSRFRRPRVRPITLMLYYPLPSLNGIDCSAGFFADVAPHLNEKQYSIVFQPANSGETGGFFATEDYAETFAAVTTTITEQTQASYRKQFPNYEARTKQVEWEAARYPEIPFSEPDAPPVGISMHQLSISTAPVELDESVRVPSLGTAYKLTKDTTDLTIGKELLPASLVAAQVTVKKRIDLLFGHRFHDGPFLPTWLRHWPRQEIV